MGNDSQTFEPDDRVVIELDSRRRVSLGDLAGSNRRFLARVERGGVIILEPAVVMTKPEMELLKNPELAAEIERALTIPTSRVQRGRRPASS